MRTAAHRLKNIVAKKDIVPLLTHFISAQGMLYAGNGKLSACVPCVSGDFIVQATDFYKFISKIEGEVKIKPLENGHVQVSCGRFRATFPGIKDAENPFPKPHGNGYPITAALIEKLWAIRPYISDNATQQWATCALVRNGCVYATNNVAVVRAEGTGLPLDKEFLVPYDAIDYLAANPQGIQSIEWDDHGTSFIWEDGAWLRCPHYSFTFPNVEKVFDDLPEADWEITDDWRGCYNSLSELSADGDIVFYADKMQHHAGMGGGLLEAEVETPICEEMESMAFGFRFLDPVVKDSKGLWFFKGTWGPQLVFQTEYVFGTCLGIRK